MSKQSGNNKNKPNNRLAEYRVIRSSWYTPIMHNVTCFLSIADHHITLLRWLRQASMWTSTVQTTGHRKFMVCFADKKSTIGFYFVSCYCIVVDDVNKKIGFHGNTPPSRKQHPLIKAVLILLQPMRCRIFLITRQSWYCSNALHTKNSELPQ